MKKLMLATIIGIMTFSSHAYITTYDMYTTYYDNNGYSYAIPTRNELDSRNHVNDLFANLLNY